MKTALTTLVIIAGALFYVLSPTEQVALLLPYDSSMDDPNGILILVHKENNQVIPDFQEHAREGILMGNAVRAGLGVEEDFMEVRVSKDAYGLLKDSYIAQLKPTLDAEKVAHEAEIKGVIDKAKSKLTQKELEELEEAILHGHRFNENPTH